jgi:hypothetical protein
MSTPATFDPNTPTPTPNDQDQSLGGAYEPNWERNHNANEQKYRAKQEDIAAAKAQARANFLKNEKPNPTDPQNATSIFDSALDPNRRSQAHLANPHY